MSADDILQDALALPAKERARLALELSKSLDPPGEDVTPEQWTEAWGPELMRRAEELRTGVVKGIPWEEAMAQLRAELQSL